MAKVGLKDTLALLAKGYSKKEIDALAAVDEESEKESQAPVQAQTVTVPSEDNKAQDDATVENSNPEPDYKAMYEDLLKKTEDQDSEIKEKDEKIKKIQKENINSNSLPDIEKQKKESHDSLIDAIRSFY